MKLQCPRRERSVPLRVGGSKDADDRRSASGCQMQRSGVAPDKELRPLQQSDELSERGWERDGWGFDASSQDPVYERLFTGSPSQNAGQPRFARKPVMQTCVVFRRPVFCVPATARIQNGKISNLARGQLL